MRKPAGAPVLLIGLPLLLSYVLPLAMVPWLSPLQRNDRGVGEGLGGTWWLAIPFFLSVLVALYVAAPSTVRSFAQMAHTRDLDRRNSGGLRPRRITAVALGFSSLYLAQAWVSGRSLDSLWRLSGEVRYSGGTGSGGVAALSSLVTAVVVVLPAVVLAARASKVQMFGMYASVLFMAALAFGRGIRSPIVAALLLCAFALHAKGRRFSAYGLVAGLPALILAVGVARSGGVLADARLETLTRSLDSLTSTEAVADLGLQPGSLEGAHLAAQVELFLPRALFPGKVSVSPLDQVLDTVFVGRAGTSTPLWSAGWFDLGFLGLILYGLIVGFVIGAVTRSLPFEVRTSWLFHGGVGMVLATTLTRSSLLQLVVALVATTLALRLMGVRSEVSE